MISRQRDVAIILGQTGGGKTQKALELTRALPRVLILDADFAEFPAIQYDDLAAMADDLDRRGVEKTSVPFRASYTPLEEDYELCFEMAREIENCTLVLEEADRFSWAALPQYRRAVLRGRHWGVSLLALAPAATLIPLNLRRQARRIISFRQLYPDDVKELARQVGPLAYQFAPDADGHYPLPDFYFLDWNSKAGAKIFDANGREVSPAKNKPLTGASDPDTIPSRPARREEVVDPGGAASSLAGSESDVQEP